MTATLSTGTSLALQVSGDYVAVPGVTELVLTEITRRLVSVTAIDDADDSYVPTRRSLGSVSVTGFYDPSNATHLALRDAAYSGTTEQFLIVVPTSPETRQEFAAIPESFSITPELDGANLFSISLKITAGVDLDSGAQIPVQVAIDAADAAVARLGTSTEYQKDIVWQGVYNCSLNGTWQHVDHCLIPKAGTSTQLVDIKGDVIPVVNGSPTHTDQVGMNLTPGDYISMSIDVAGLGYASRYDYSMGVMFDNFVPGVSGATGIFAGSGDSGQTNTVFAWNNSGSNFVGYFEATFSNQVLNPSSVLDGLIVDLSAQPLADEVGGKIESRIRTVGNSYDGTLNWQNPITTGRIETVYINANSSGAQSIGEFDWSFFYVADRQMDFDVFATEMQAMLEALSYSQHPFTDVLEDSDSLHAGSETFAGVMDYVTTMENIDRNAVGGKPLSTMLTNLPGNIAGGSFDSLLIGGGTNDIAIFGDDQTALNASVNGVFAEFDTALAAGDLSHMIIRTIPPFRGFGSIWDAAKQTLIEDTNALIISEAALRPNVYVVDYYTLLDSPSKPNRIMGTYYADGDSGQSNELYTHPDDPDYSYEGLHLDELGARFLAFNLDEKVREIRYYKGGRTS